MYKIIIQLIIFILSLLPLGEVAEAAELKTLISLYANFAVQNTTQVAAVFNFKPHYRLSSLPSSNKILFECDKLNKILNVRAGGIVKSIKNFERADQTVFTLDLSDKFIVKKNQLQELAPGLWQVSFDIVSRNIKSQYLQAITQTNIVKTIMQPRQASAGKPFIVVIDPGHGGIDSGAVATDGVMEKNLTLQFAKILKNILSSNKNLRVFLTRTTDKYLYLSERVQKARACQADLFISIHADIINSPKIRGSTIYSLSAVGSDRLAQQLAVSQNKVDELGGSIPPALPKVENILLDLTKKETDKFRAKIVKLLVSSMQQENIKLINHPDRSANFYVLKALEFPSILIELGYLSNRSDEFLIKDGRWQVKMANSMAKAIEKFRKYRLANSSNQR